MVRLAHSAVLGGGAWPLRDCLETSECPRWTADIGGAVNGPPASAAMAWPRPIAGADHLQSLGKSLNIRNSATICLTSLIVPN